MPNNFTPDNIPLKSSKKDQRPFYFKYFPVVICVLLALILLPGYLLLVKPEYLAHRTDSSAINDAQAEITSLLRRLKELKVVKASYATIDAAAAEKVNVILPTGEDLPSLYVNLEALAKSVQVELASFNVEVAAEDAKPIAKGTDAVASGFVRRPDTALTPPENVVGNLRLVSIAVAFKNVNYGRLKNLLTAFESNLRLMDVQTFDFNPTDSTASFKVVTYYIE